MRAILIVLDGLGVGSLPDANHYGCSNSNTVKNAIGNKSNLLPFLYKFGFSYFLNQNYTKGENIIVGKLNPITKDNDSAPIHWEMMGIVRKKRLPLYPKGIPQIILKELERETGYEFIGNIMVEKGQTLKNLRDKHKKTGMPIIYSTTDSVIQVASMEKYVSLKDLYMICEIARKLLPDVGRIIAKPFIVDQKGSYQRDNKNRKDYIIDLHYQNSLLLKLQEQKIPTIAIGKIIDFFQGKGISKEIKTGSNLEGIKAIIKSLKKLKKGFIFSNLVEFDMMGHSNNVKGMFDLLKQFDNMLPEIIKNMKKDDLLILTSDHGCDPTKETKTHTREYGILVCYHKKIKTIKSIGTHWQFIDIASTLADYFEVNFNPGKSFYKKIYN